MKPLLLFYSYSGNTKRIAELFCEEIGGTLCEIQTAQPYVGSYNDVVNQGQREVESGYMPALQPLTVDFGSYDAILLGTPVWWYTYAPAVRTLFHTQDFSGKRIYPFATNGGWLGHTFQDIVAACPNATIAKGLNIRFDGARLCTPEAELLQWVRAIR